MVPKQSLKFAQVAEGCRGCAKSVTEPRLTGCFSFAGQAVEVASSLGSIVQPETQLMS